MSGMKILIRADADSKIGTGHVMRCLALAQACRDGGGEATVATSSIALSLIHRMSSEGISIHNLDADPGTERDAEYTSKVAQLIDAEWVVVDGYEFGSAYQNRLKREGRHLLVLDDDGDAGHYYADVILNQNLHANEKLYAEREPYTRLLLGTKYVLLRREFLLRKRRRRIRKIAQRLLVTLGGADPASHTLTVLRTLSRLEKRNGLEIKIVVGPCNPHLPAIQKFSSSAFGTAAKVETDVEDMASVMEWADLAISSDGTTVWELAFMGVPAIVGTISPVERLLVKGLREQGLFLHVGPFTRLTERRLSKAITTCLDSISARKRMSLLGQQLVDGKGCVRTLMELRKAADLQEET
jgi:UDP-2,4-diacetamido-2,4,6-trideoxy-beta-L-altropyranose hydrolase